MVNEKDVLENLGKSIIQKFVTEEIMTRSELDIKLDSMMQKYVGHIDKKFNHIDEKFNHMDEKFNHMEGRFKILLTVMGISVATTISLIALVVKLH